MPKAFDNLRVQKAIEVFGVKILGRTSVCSQFEAFLYQIRAGGRRAVEIGTYNGISTMILAQFFEEVVALTWEEPIADRSLKYKVWDAVGVKNIRAIELANDYEKPEAMAKLDFNFAYLDGNHLQHTDSDFALTKHCGRVLFHEYWPLQPPVWNLVRSLPPSEVTVADYDCLAYWEASAQHDLQL